MNEQNRILLNDITRDALTLIADLISGKLDLESNNVRLLAANVALEIAFHRRPITIDDFGDE